MSFVESRLAAVEARLAALEARVSGTKQEAKDVDLDGPYGDPIVKHDPKRWLANGGASYSGRKMSACPSDYLRALAELYDWQADQDEKSGRKYTNKHGVEVPTAPLRRQDAARARGWAARNEGRAAGPSDVPDPSEIPF